MSTGIIGRETECAELLYLAGSSESEFVALYGRRRVGKTFLVRELLSKNYLFVEITGRPRGDQAVQLRAFAVDLGEALLDGITPAIPANWHEAFMLLRRLLERKADGNKLVVFIDELPWLAGERSSCLAELDAFWNTWCTKRRDIFLIVCGSAASWMLRKIVHARGGLHNRVTRSIRLMPFSVREATSLLKSRGIHWNLNQILHAYMVLGGVPHYLRHIKPRLSAAQAINSLCFVKDGALTGEFDRLYAALFKQPARHLAVVKQLSNHPHGMVRSDLLAAAGLSSGGRAKDILMDLTEAGFIASSIWPDRRKKGELFRLCDEFSAFYFYWMSEAPRGVFPRQDSDYWLAQLHTPRWYTWAGMAFELLCLKHISEIKQALGIASVFTNESTWYAPPQRGEKGAQVDLVIDRRDDVISLCEIKFSDAPFRLTAKDASRLRNVADLFRRRTKTKKQLQWVFITANGLAENEHSSELVAQRVLASNLFS